MARNTSAQTAISTRCATSATSTAPDTMVRSLQNRMAARPLTLAPNVMDSRDQGESVN